MPRSKDKRKKPSKIGGFFFFISLLIFLFISCSGLVALPSTLPGSSLPNLLWFSLAGAMGYAIAKMILRAHISVLIHESKHMIVALLAGNRAKGMRVTKDSGHFEYEYSDESAGYNAFISLAPYYVPLFTVLALIGAFLLLREQHLQMVILVGLGWGMDVSLNTRDISRYQTDFSGLIGGFPIGVAYVLAVNLVIFIALLAWVAAGFAGLQSLYLAITKIALR